jgi:outer membrane protein assembly factor BamA
MKGDYEFTWVGDKLLRENVLIRNCPILPGDMYNEVRVERAYSNLNQLAPIKYVDISFDPISEDELDCHIVLSRSKLNSISVEAEGTYSAGDWGIAVGAGYANRNLFRGAEEFTVDGRTSYEWRQNGGRAIEAKASTGLKFPNSLAIDLNYNYQNRPDEYTRSIFGAGLQYQLRQRLSRWQHQFRFADISYVYLPWISDAFRDQFLQSTNILKYSYENHFIVGWGYSGNYSSFASRQPYRSYTNLNYNIETAGNLMLGLAEAFRFPTDSEGKYTLFGTRFAQFAKADVSFTYNQIFNPSHRLVYHADLGLAVPYANSQAVPFEKRYFAGGSNSVRGWTARSLGPGGYRGKGSMIDFNNQSGDIRLNLSVEYRAKVWSIIELAAFVDAGNIWTIFDYETQPNGQFHWNEFYKQIALAYGVGVRLDFSIFVFRVDFGVKLYDPSRLYDQWAGTQWRTVPNGLNWKEDMSFHFAIGYPF